MIKEQIDTLLSAADRIVATDLYPAICRDVIAKLSSALREEQRVEVRFTWASEDQEFWLHMKLPDGRAAGINLGNPRGMIATACLRSLTASDSATVEREA